MANDKDKDAMVLLTKWEVELVDLEQEIHGIIEKFRKRLFEKKLALAKIEVTKPVQVDFDEQNRHGKPDRD